MASARATPRWIATLFPTPIPFARLCVKLWNTLVLPMPAPRSPDRSRFAAERDALGEQVTYLLNYSADEVAFDSPVSGDVVVAPVVVGTDGTVDESATAAIALKEGSKVEVGDRLTIGRWNVVVIAG